MNFLIDGDTLLRFLRNHVRVKGHVLAQLPRVHFSVVSMTEVESYLSH